MVGTPKRPPTFLAAILLPLAATVFVACSESTTVNDDPLPTFTEHLDANGTVVRLTLPESWDGTYPVRSVQVDEAGQVVAEHVIETPPTGDPIAELTPSQRAEAAAALEAVAAMDPANTEIRDAIELIKGGEINVRASRGRGRKV